MLSMNYHFRPSTRGERYPGSIYLRVICNRQVRTVTMPWKIYLSEWAGSSDPLSVHRLRIISGSYRMTKLRRIEKEMYKTHSYLQELTERMENEDREITASAIVSALRRLHGSIQLMEYTEKVAVILEGQEQIRTARAYRTAVRRLCGMTGNENIELREITSFLIRRFEDRLRSEGKTLNTISFYMRNLRAIRNRAIREGLLEDTLSDPFERVFTGVERTRKRALSKEEIKLLQEWDPFIADSEQFIIDSEKVIEDNKKQKSSVSTPDAERHKHLRTAQMYFLFSLYTRGMSFVDLAYLKKENIQNGILRYNRKKTGQLLEIKVTPEIQSIIYCFEKETMGSPYVFPIIKRYGNHERLQYESALRLYNKHLKQLARICFHSRPYNYQWSAIHCHLSSHMARHTWATLAKKAGIPLIVISEALGHTSEKTTAIYLDSLDRSFLDHANKKVIQSIKSAG